MTILPDSGGATWIEWSVALVVFSIVFTWALYYLVHTVKWCAAWLWFRGKMLFRKSKKSYKTTSEAPKWDI